MEIVRMVREDGGGYAVTFSLDGSRWTIFLEAESPESMSSKLRLYVSNFEDEPEKSIAV